VSIIAEPYPSAIAQRCGHPQLRPTASAKGAMSSGMCYKMRIMMLMMTMIIVRIKTIIVMMTTIIIKQQ
jgi:hypothetical protein